MTIKIPNLSLVLLMGPSSCGKSTFARKHFLPTEVITSDFCRALVADDENDQGASNDAFDVLHYIAAKRLTRGRLVVADATHVQRDSRAPMLALARAQHVLPIIIAFDMPEDLLHERNQARPDRNLPPRVIHRHRSEFRQSMARLEKEGFRFVHMLRSPEEVEECVLVREPTWTDRRSVGGPFDIVGDVHGCLGELEELVAALGYSPEGVHPEGRRLVFVGDLVDRGPSSAGVLRLVMGYVERGAFCVPGNHDVKLLKWLQGRKVQQTHGLGETVAQLEAESAEFRERVKTFLDGLISHFVLDEGRLVVAHAGMKEAYQGRASGTVREFALYGDTTGETDELGLPVRLNWAADYRGRALVVYGHTPVGQPDWLNNTVNIDTGCAFGGALTALRYPERELVSVPARATYYEPARPLTVVASQRQQDDLLDLADFSGKRVLKTALQTAVIHEDNMQAALEVMSRFAIHPRWLIYLPPTMSPCETSSLPGYLEHPAEAFAYFRDQGVGQVVCQEKHMGSRAVVVVCRTPEAASQRFGVEGESGIIYTRTGRRFFNDLSYEEGLLEVLRARMDETGFWERHGTDWACLDAELMPWSAKAEDLIRSQYAAVGAAGSASLQAAVQVLERGSGRGLDLGGLVSAYRERSARVTSYVRAYEGYCWPVGSVADLKLAPFHLLATEGAAHADKDHLWHMQALEGLATPTPHRVVDTTDSRSVEEAVAWWEELTGGGGEGMVVKPLSFVTRGTRGLVQPAVKCRGRNYLRIIYGPEYDDPRHLPRLRRRSLAAKRRLALREFALGLEALERFVRCEPLRRVHECVFAVLALETEPVDPRL